MTLALNTGHALYGNLKMLLCVNEAGDTLLDLVTPARTFTKHASAVYGTGTLGRHAGVRRSAYTTYGWAFDSNFVPANNTGTLLIVTNSVTYIESSTTAAGAFLSTASASNGARRLPQLGRKNTAGATAACYYSGGGSLDLSSNTTTAIYNVSPAMLTLARNGEIDYAIYTNGNTTPEVTGTRLGSNDTTGYYSYLGGVNNTAAMDFNLVYACWFDAVLTPTQIADLYTSLGASNAFALLASGATTHATSGALTGQSSTVAGTAAHIAKHATSGTLSGQIGSVAGTAARTRSHPSSGVLTGPGSAIAGTAARVSGAVTHATTGALSGQGSAVTGTASHIAKHATSGSLTGSGAAITGSAARIAAAVSHATSGVLTGQGAVVAGTAKNGIKVGRRWAPQRKILVTIKGARFLVPEDELDGWLAQREEQIVTSQVLDVVEKQIRPAPKIKTTDRTARAAIQQTNQRIAQRLAAQEDEDEAELLMML